MISLIPSVVEARICKRTEGNWAKINSAIEGKIGQNGLTLSASYGLNAPLEMFADAEQKWCL